MKGEYLRVLMVTPCYDPIKGGTETVVRNLSIELNKNNLHVDVMTFNMDKKWSPKWHGDFKRIDDINVIKIPAINWYPITHSNRITMGVNLIPGRFTHLFDNYDIIHFHEDVSFPLFSYFSRKLKIFHLHGLDKDFQKRYFFSRFIMKNIADIYICLTKQMKNDLISLGISENKIRRLPNGVNTDIFFPSVEKEKNLLLFVGRITPIKGLHVLIDSLSFLKTPVSLIIFGPFDKDIEYSEYILNAIKSTNERGRHKIIYMGRAEQRDLAKWYPKASLFISPSLTEAFSMVNIEALSCGTPVVSTNVGGIPEVVCNRSNGILVPPNNPLKLAQAIDHLLLNEDIRKQYGIEGRKWVIENFSLTVVVDQLIQIYKELYR